MFRCSNEISGKVYAHVRGAFEKYLAELHRFCCFPSIFRKSLFYSLIIVLTKYDCFVFFSSACTAGRIKLVYIVFWWWYDLFTIFTIQTRRKGCGFIHSTTSPGSIVSPETDQSKCLSDMQILSPNAVWYDRIMSQRVGGFVREQEVVQPLHHRGLMLGLA